MADSEPPGVTLFEIVTHINGLYRATQMPIGGPSLEDVSDGVKRVLPIVEQVRRGLGWRQREIDIGMMRWIRRSSAVSIVIGAGVTQGAGGPGWVQ